LSKQIPPELSAQMLDEFFGEADEHLVGIRQALLHLEASVGKAQPDTKAVEDLFLHIHSFKGISAIVGLGAAEAVAHASEDFLRLMRSGTAALTEKGLEVLTTAVQKLEQIVAAFRSHHPMPGYESLLAELKHQCEQCAITSSPPVEATGISALSLGLLTRIEEAKSRGLLLWRFTFSPSRELDAQGANLNSIRTQLATVGEIIKSTPLIKGQGVVAFEFLVSTRETPTDIAAWEAKGVTVQPVESTDTGAATTSEDAGHNPFLAPSHVVRVDLKRLDDLMRITGEMVIHRSRLETQLAQLQGNARRLDLRGVQETSGAMGRSLRDLREGIMRVRLVSVGEIFARMPFVVRDLARQTRKQVRLKLAGQETAVDKYLIERLKDPLLHLVRNAFSHGVESAAERAAASKSEEATIELKASTAGDSVLIQVRDDGRGINPNAIIERAKKLGFEIPETINNETLLSIICSPGFSTREDVDRASGRGVGMAVVCGTVRELGGTLTMESDEGQGSQFTIRLPLTLAIADTFIVTAAGQTCAVPQSFVREILPTTETDIQVVNGIEVIPYRDGVLPVVRLSGLFRLPTVPKAKSRMLVIESTRGSVGLLTEAVVGQREVVVRALRDPLIQVQGVSGATELGDGKPVLILDGAALTAGSVRPLERGSSNGGGRPAADN
jgi:two-component system chemotaxis sensor kinase CheA